MDCWTWNTSSENLSRELERSQSGIFNIRLKMPENLLSSWLSSKHERWLRPIVSYSQQLKFKTWLLDPSLDLRSSWRKWIPDYCNSNHFVQKASVKLAVLMRKHSAIAATGNSNLCACERFKITDSFGDSLTRNALQANWDTDSTLRCWVELLRIFAILDIDTVAEICTSEVWSAGEHICPLVGRINNTFNCSSLWLCSWYRVTNHYLRWFPL